MNATVESQTIQLRRHIKCSPQRAFAAWTKPAQVKTWFGPTTCTVLDANIDLRVGGSYQIRVRNEEMGEVSVTGVYREISSPSKLVFTWKWEDDEDWIGLDSVVTVEFAAKEGG